MGSVHASTLLGCTLSITLSGCSLLFSATAAEFDAGPVESDASDALACGPDLAGTIGRFSIAGDEDQSIMHNSVGEAAHGKYYRYKQETGLSDWEPLTESHASLSACDTVLRLPNSTNPHLGIVPSDAFPLAHSVDFWFKVGGVGNGDLLALLTKGQPDVVAGDFALFLYKRVGEDYRVVLRGQHGNGAGNEFHLCSTQIDGGWHHVAISFDDALLFVDGTRANEVLNAQSGPLTLSGPYFAADSSCVPAGFGITVGETSPDWFWGMSNDNSDRPGEPFRGLLDELRFRDQPFTELDAKSVHQALQP